MLCVHQPAASSIPIGADSAPEGCAASSPGAAGPHSEHGAWRAGGGAPGRMHLAWLLAACSLVYLPFERFVACERRAAVHLRAGQMRPAATSTFTTTASYSTSAQLPNLMDTSRAQRVLQWIDGSAELTIFPVQYRQNMLQDMIRTGVLHATHMCNKTLVEHATGVNTASASAEQARTTRPSWATQRTFGTRW